MGSGVWKEATNKAICFVNDQKNFTKSKLNRSRQKVKEKKWKLTKNGRKNDEMIKMMKINGLHFSALIQIAVSAKAGK